MAYKYNNTIGLIHLNPRYDGGKLKEMEDYNIFGVLHYKIARGNVNVSYIINIRHWKKDYFIPQRSLLNL